MKISIFGSGYVGLVTGACFADVGHHVCCVDTDSTKIQMLKKGEIPIYEPGLEPLVNRNIESGHLQFTTDPELAIDEGEIILIAVGTPSDEDGSADLKYVTAVARTIGQHMKSDKIVVDKSTVPVGTAELVKRTVEVALQERGVDHAVEVCSNPEFLKEGDAINDFNRPARIIIGTDSDHVATQMRACYAPFNRSHDRLMVMDIRSAELTKYAANAMLATKISFMNELANVAEAVGADIEKVRMGIGSDPRIGYHFIYAGAGYGGSCFPKDVRALRKTASEANVDPRLLTAVEAVNENQKDRLFKMLTDALGEVRGKTIGVWGLAFKPNTDDMREAPSRVLINSVLKASGKIKAFDPIAGDEAKRLFGNEPGFQLSESNDAAVEDVDALVICTEWPQFRAVDTELLTRSMSPPVVIDGRNIFDPETMKSAGITYYSIGRQPVLA